MNVKQVSQLLGVSDVKQVHVLSALLDSYPEVKTANWKTDALKEFSQHEDSGPLSDVLSEMNYLPDAFSIHKENDLLEMTFFEVEIHSPMAGDKLRSYGKFAIDLGYYDVQFSLMTVNKYGHINEVDLLPYYADWLRKDVQ